MKIIFSTIAWFVWFTNGYSLEVPHVPVQPKPGLGTAIVYGNGVQNDETTDTEESRKELEISLK